MNKFGIFTNGLVKENPLLILNIGLCSSLAVTTSVSNGLGMGVAMTFVLLMSELIISIFRKVIPASVRLPVFIIVIAAFTTIVDLVLKAYVEALAESLGVFIPLIVVNCIIMGRVEAFASKKSPLDAGLDALGMGVGYTWVLAVISLIREVLGNGTLTLLPKPLPCSTPIEIIPEAYRIAFFSRAPGGFFVFGVMIALTFGISSAVAASKAKKAKDGE